MVLICKKFNVGLNTLWQWTYCFLVIIAEGYLMYRAVLRCKEYNELPWPSNDKPVAELYIYIALIVISLMCIPFFFITAIFKVGNYANDGVRLGRDDILDPSLAPRLPLVEEELTSSVTSQRAHLLWRHSGPLCVGFHIMAAFSLLMPTVLMDAQKIKHGFLHYGVLWQSELDVLVEDKGPIAFGAIATNSTSSTPSPLIKYPNEWETMSVEFVNYVMALIVFSIRYPSVFWYTKITFSLIFSAQLLIATIFYVFAYCSFTLVYKFRMNIPENGDMELVLPAGIIVLLYILGNTVVYFSSIAVFHYGFQHYNEAYLKDMISKRRLPKRLIKAPPTGCQGYIPHTTATVALVLFITFRAPIVYDCVSLYRKTGNTISLAAIIWDVCYMFLWITMWFFFTIKQSWLFKVHLSLPNSPNPDRRAVRVQQLNNIAAATTNHMPLNNTQDTEASNTDNNANQIQIPTVSQAVDNAVPMGTSHDESDSVVPNRTSALRKSKERKNANVRVTFEDSQDEIANADLQGVNNDDAEQASPRRARRRKKDPSPDSGVPQGATNDPKASREQKSKSMVGGFPLDTTPENTLTRNYRHSIRDKCGQYYRNSREFAAAPPAAQSSPVLPPRQREVSKHQPGVLVFNPNTRKPKILRTPPEVRQMSPIRSVDGSPSNSRQVSPIRHSSPIRNASPNRQYSNHSPSRSSQPPLRNSHPVLTTSSSSVLPQQFRSNLNQRTSSPARTNDAGIPPLMERPKSSLSTGHSNGHSNPSYSSDNPQESGAMASKQLSDILPPRPPRELRIINGKSNKPEIGRRDSALPSSNETSSNDSGENVLCSQV